MNEIFTRQKHEIVPLYNQMTYHYIGVADILATYCFCFEYSQHDKTLATCFGSLEMRFEY